MRISRKQLRKIVREATQSTKKYDDDSALKGDQDELPDPLQKAIIDKTVEDREKNLSGQVLKAFTAKNPPVAKIEPFFA